jgi:NADPH2:quinone reductase
MNRVLLKNFSAVGLHWGAYFEHDAAKIRAAQDALFAMRKEGRIAPVISATYALDDAAKALDALGGRATTGKVLLRP